MSVKLHLGRYFNGCGRERFGLVYPLDRNDYRRDFFNWVYEDDVPSEGIIIVSNRISGDFRYVVVAGFSSYRAIITDTGEILESDSFKAVYRFALSHIKDWFTESEQYLSGHIVFDKVDYSDYERLNEYGYMQRDIVRKDSMFAIRVYRDHSIERW